MTTLREKCPNTVFFLDQIQENTDQKNPLFGHCSRSVKYKIFAIMIIKQFIKRLIAISPHCFINKYQVAPYKSKLDGNICQKHVQ